MPRTRIARVAGVVKLLLVCVFVFATCGPSVDAQEDSAASFFRADRERLQLLRQQSRPSTVQRPTRMVRRAAPPPRGYAREFVAPRRETPASAHREAPVANPSLPAAQQGDAASTVADAAAPKPAPAKAAEPAFTIAVIGDSLGQMLSQGLTEAFADKPEIVVLRKARENSGLVRDDYYDWVKNAREIAASADKINLAVMMVGSNDRQALRDAGVTVEPRTPRWTQAYGDRVEAIAQSFRDRKIPLLWVGLPVMKNDRFSAEMAAFNEIFKDRAVKAGAAYIDSWEPFLDDRGLYAAYGPDVNGQFQKLRSADGVHFTRPGARKLAYFLEAEVRRAVDATRPKVEQEIAALAPPRLQPEPAPAAAVPMPPPRGSGDPIIFVPIPPAAPQVVIPVRPAEGAVVALNAPALAPGGQLVSRARSPGDAHSLIDRVIVQGRPLEARPGRADDFNWPRR